jgi:hypothetical protein
MGDEEECILHFGGIHFEKRPLGRPRRRWVDDINIDLRVIGCEDRV